MNWLFEKHKNKKNKTKKVNEFKITILDEFSEEFKDIEEHSHENLDWVIETMHEVAKLGFLFRNHPNVQPERDIFALKKKGRQFRGYFRQEGDVLIFSHCILKDFDIMSPKDYEIAKSRK